MFEKSVRLKVRFPFRGQCSVEDLWDLSVEDLDVIYKTLSRQAREQGEDSLLDEQSQANEILDLQIAIVKHVVSVKLQEREARQNKALMAMRKQKLLGIIEEKQDAELRDMPVEDLQKLVDDLGE